MLYIYHSLLSLCLSTCDFLPDVRGSFRHLCSCGPECCTASLNRLAQHAQPATRTRTRTRLYTCILQSLLWRRHAGRARERQHHPGRGRETQHCTARRPALRPRESKRDADSRPAGARRRQDQRSWAGQSTSQKHTRRPFHCPTEAPFIPFPIRCQARKRDQHRTRHPSHSHAPLYSLLHFRHATSTPQCPLTYPSTSSGLPQRGSKHLLPPRLLCPCCAGGKASSSSSSSPSSSSASSTAATSRMPPHPFGGSRTP